MERGACLPGTPQQGAGHVAGSAQRFGHVISPSIAILNKPRPRRIRRERHSSVSQMDHLALVQSNETRGQANARGLRRRGRPQQPRTRGGRTTALQAQCFRANRRCPVVVRFGWIVGGFASGIPGRSSGIQRRVGRTSLEPGKVTRFPDPRGRLVLLLQEPSPAQMAIRQGWRGST